uniref:A kinase (PRKA) anchor protein 6 n=1 Tax=Seriola lalandi dorsalis TaxID=1841481 RepID=A0A3B4WX12_SERLL
YAMSIVALSPMAPEPPSPMVTSITPVTPTVLKSEGSGTTGLTHSTCCCRSKKPPPLHTGADWKVVLHLPEIETWLRATSDRVTQLTHSVGQDSDNRHVDVHLVQLKDICEDISDHVEQIHALLETEFSLKLLSYSVNIIVDIRTVQLLWHQLRVSVLVLKERLLQGLQDSNGNYTRQTDILQAFSQDQHQTRLDALTEVDDCGQLTIRCSQDYFSLDCGITAFELSDYSPGDEPDARGAEPDAQDASEEQEQELDRAPDLNPELGSAENEGPCSSNPELHSSLPELTAASDLTNHNHSMSMLPTMQCSMPSHSESAKRPLQGVSHSTEVSPTQPSLPKRAALFSDRGTGVQDSRGGLGKNSPLSGLQFQAELSRSTPSLMDPPDRSKFWLELDSVYPENVSQSYESLQVGVMNGRNLQRNHVSSRHGGRSEGRQQRPPTEQRSSSAAGPTADAPPPPQDPASPDGTWKQMEKTQKETHTHSEGDSDSSLPSPMRERVLSSDLESIKLGSSKASPDREHWYGSEEFLALPAQLRKTEMLAMKLESLAQSIPPEALQDVDDWDLTELNPDWDLPYRRNLVSRFSPTSSSDIAPSVGESIESGPLSDLQSEDDDEGRRSADIHLQPTAPLVDGRRGASLVHQLLEDIQSQDKDPDIWRKIELHFMLMVNEQKRSLSLKDILHMVSSQWDQLQRQIRRQHGWMLRALRCIQARLLYTGQSHELFAASTEPSASRLCDAQRAALEQMAVKLSSLRYPSSASRRHYSQLAKSNSLQEFEAEYQELWDWLMDMDAMVTDSHQLMMSEEQRHHLFKLMMMESRKTGLLGRAESLKRSGTELPRPSSSQRKRSASVNSLLVGGRGVAAENPRSALSPLTNSLLEQLEARIKELKAWLRDTELLIFHSCLRQDKDAAEQLRSFKALCSEVRARRRGVASVLKLCQKLLQQSQALQLLSINLERRWEAIVMQALQWQNRLKRELGEQQVPGNFLEPGLVDLHQISPVPAEPEPQEAPEPDLMLHLPSEPDLPPDGALSNGNQPDRVRTGVPANQCPENMSSIMRGSSSEVQPSLSSQPVPPNNNIYQVYSLHNVQLYRQPPFPHTPSSLLKTKPGKQKQQLLLKSLSKDSSFSSIESLPDLLGGLVGSGQSANSRRSECESGIVSDTGDMETATNSEIQGEEEEDEEERKDGTKFNQRIKTEEKGWRRNREEEKRRRHRRGGGEAVEILINGRGILTPADSDSDFEVGGHSSKPFKPRSDITAFKAEQFNGLETPVLSQGSSLESLLALGVELFPSKDPLQRSASLESCLAPSGKEEKVEHAQGEPSSGELSRRTLDLLKRLEDIQSPLAAKMTRSVSDMTLRSSSLQRSRLPASPSLGGPPSLINESSATASLTELSSTEDSSLGSEDFAMLRNQRHIFLDPTMAANANSGSCRKRCHGNSRGGQGMDEADAASLSMVVNVSSACTDEDEDDSDLLSSSTLTLTEEELGVRDGEDEEEDRLSGASSGNEDDEDDDEEEMEGSYVLGLEYMKRELQSWIRSPRTSSSSKTEAGLRDELQCGTHLSSAFTGSSQNKEPHCFLNRSAAKLMETNANSGNNKVKREKKEQQEEEEEENRRNATRSYISQFVDDVENGNVEQSCLKGKDEDDELLREESSVFTKKGESLREVYVFAKTGESIQDVGDLIVKTESNSTKVPSSSPTRELLPLKRASSLVGELRGELPCHSSSLPSPPSFSPVEDCRSHDAMHNSRPAVGGRKAITIQEKFKFSSFVTEETRREVRDKDSSLPPKRRHSSHSSCFHHLPSPSSALHPCGGDEGKKENVHDFVMEIIDLTSLALKSKEDQPEEPNRAETGGSGPDHSSASLTQIRDKVTCS